MLYFYYFFNLIFLISRTFSVILTQPFEMYWRLFWGSAYNLFDEYSMCIWKECGFFTSVLLDIRSSWHCSSNLCRLINFFLIFFISYWIIKYLIMIVDLSISSFSFINICSTVAPLFMVLLFVVLVTVVYHGLKILHKKFQE